MCFPIYPSQKRINGGTNIEAALELARSLMSAPPHSLMRSGSADTTDNSQPPLPGATHSLATVPPLPVTQGYVPPTLTPIDAPAPPATPSREHCSQTTQPAPPRIVVMLTDGRVDRYQVGCISNNATAQQQQQCQTVNMDYAYLCVTHACTTNSSGRPWK